MAMDNKLTDVKIRAIKPMKDGPKVKRYSDGHGLNLVVSQSGGKWWEYRFRFEGKAQTLSIGSYPVVSLAEARKRHLAAQTKLESGQNPAAEKQARKMAEKAETLTFRKVAVAFLESRRENGYAERAIDDICKRLEKHIFPALGDLPLEKITTPATLDVLSRQTQGHPRNSPKVQAVYSRPLKTRKERGYKVHPTKAYLV